MSSVNTLARVNSPQAETWNYLAINGVRVSVPAAPAHAAVPEAPAWTAPAGEPLAGLGAEAEDWLAAQAGTPREVEVAAGAAEDVVVRVNPCSGEAFAATYVRVADGASARVLVIAEAEHPAEGIASGGTDDELAVATAGNETSAVAVENAETAPATCGSLLRIAVAQNARVDVRLLVALDASYQYLDALTITAASDAQVTVAQYVADAGNALLGVGIELAGFRARADLTSHYLVRGTSALDMNYLVRQAGAKTLANVDAYGVLTDSARKTMRDTIDFVRGSRQARGREQETVLLAGERVVNKSLPTILCAEEDMQGDHGATIGSVSPEQRAYLANRGLSEADVTALFARSVLDAAAVAFPEAEAGGDALARVSARVLGTEEDE